MHDDETFYYVVLLLKPSSMPVRNGSIYLLMYLSNYSSNVLPNTLKFNYSKVLIFAKMTSKRMIDK